MNPNALQIIEEIKKEAFQAQQEAYKSGFCASCHKEISPLRKLLGSYTCSNECHIIFYKKYDYSKRHLIELGKLGKTMKRVVFTSWELSASAQDKAVQDRVLKKIERRVPKNTMDMLEPIEPYEVVIYIGNEEHPFDWSYEGELGMFQYIFDIFHFLNLERIEIWKSNGIDFVYKETREVVKEGREYKFKNIEVKSL